MAKGARQQKKAHVLAPLVAENPALLAVKMMLAKGGDCPFSFVPDGDYVWNESLEAVLRRELKACQREGLLSEVRVFATSDAAMETPCDKASIKLAGVMKPKRQIGQAHSNSITRGVVCQVPAIGGSFVHMPVLITIAWSLSSSMHRSSTMLLNRGGASPLGLRPEFDSLQLHNPNDMQVEMAVSRFMDARKELAVACNALAIGDLAAAWKDTRVQRALADAQIRSLSPAAKLIAGSGKGAESIKHALIEPTTRAENAKRDKTGLSLEALREVYWNDAYERPDRRLRLVSVEL